MKFALMLLTLSFYALAGERISDLNIGMKVSVDALESIDVDSGTKFKNGEVTEGQTYSKRFQLALPAENQSYCEISQFNTRSFFDVGLKPGDVFSVVLIDQRCGRDSENAFCKSVLNLKKGMTIFEVSCVSNFGAKNNTDELNKHTTTMFNKNLKGLLRI